MVTTPACSMSWRGSESIGAGCRDVLMKPELPPIFHRIFPVHEGRLRRIEPVVNPREKKAERRAARQNRQRSDFITAKLTNRGVPPEEGPRFCDVESMVR